MAAGGVVRKRLLLIITTKCTSSAAAVQVPAVVAPVQSPESTPMAPIRRMMTSEPESRISANCRNSS